MAPGTRSRNSSRRFAASSPAKEIDPRHVTIWQGEACDQAHPRRVSADVIDDRIVVVAALAANVDSVPVEGNLATP